MFSQTKRNPKRIFVFTKKQKVKQSSVFVLRRALIEAVHAGSFPTRLPRELASQHQHQVVIALKCISKHLCFISIYFGHLLARCVLTYQKSVKNSLSVILGIKLNISIMMVVNKIKTLYRRWICLCPQREKESWKLPKLQFVLLV